MNDFSKNKDMIKYHNRKNKKRNDKVFVVSRLLFISVLDKIYLINLALIFCWLNFDMFNCCYEVGEKILWELVIFIAVFICYLIFNWLYKCMCKTMLYLTRDRVCKVSCFPFFKKETSIPLNKITGVTTFKFLYIFRALIIHQYGKVPLMFFTWNNQEFKNALDSLISGDFNYVYNNYDSNSSFSNDYGKKNIVTNEQHGFLVVLGIIVVLVLAIGFQCCIWSAENVVTESELAGIYCLDDDCSDSKIELHWGEGSYCKVDDMVESWKYVHHCEWEYSDVLEAVEIDYIYYEKGDWGNENDFFYLYYDDVWETLETYDGDIYVKQ